MGKYGKYGKRDVLGSALLCRASGGNPNISTEMLLIFSATNFCSLRSSLKSHFWELFPYLQVSTLWPDVFDSPPFRTTSGLATVCSYLFYLLHL